jgi:hypothetical protein
MQHGYILGLFLSYALSRPIVCVAKSNPLFLISVCIFCAATLFFDLARHWRKIHRHRRHCPPLELPKLIQEPPEGPLVAVAVAVKSKMEWHACCQIPSKRQMVAKPKRWKGAMTTMGTSSGEVLLCCLGGGNGRVICIGHVFAVDKFWKSLKEI